MSNLKLECKETYPEGSVWVAINRNKEVVKVISAVAPPSVNYEAFKTNSRNALAVLGRVETGFIVHEAGRCFFVKNKRSVSAKQARVTVDASADTTGLVTTLPIGFEIVGVVTHGSETGALLRETSTGIYFLGTGADRHALPQEKVKAALFQLEKKSRLQQGAAV